jgi:hypothetical protein
MLKKKKPMMPGPISAKLRARFSHRRFRDSEVQVSG